MAAIAESASVQIMEEKMLQELKANNSYEALQYVQSFIARKKRSIVPEIVSSMVFHAAKLLVDHESAGYAGTLLLWYMDGGAGEENNFHIEKEKAELGNGVYCDLARLTSLFGSIAQEQAAVILDVIQKQVLTVVGALPPVFSTPAGKRLADFEEACAVLFEFTHNWRLAYKCRLRFGDMAKVAATLDKWSSDAYTSERPLFFSRSILTLLCEDPGKAMPLFEAAGGYIVDNDHPHMIVWHFTQIVCELYSLPGSPNINKAAIYDALAARYKSFLMRIDDRLAQLMPKIGVQCFGCKPPASGGLNPFTMLQALSGGKNGPGGGLDMGNLMSMMQSIQPPQAPQARPRK